MGAWIEIKLQEYYSMLERVAPLVGAWIEIISPPAVIFTPEVAPLVGAWIEISFFDIYI